MADYIKNEIDVDNVEDMKTIKRFMNRFHPADKIYQIEDFTTNLMIIRNIADDTYYSIDMRTNKLDYGILSLEDTYDYLINQQNRLENGMFIKDNRVRTEDGSRHFTILAKANSEEADELLNHDKFNFQYIRPQPDNMVNWYEGKDGKLEVPDHNNPNYWYNWNNRHWGSKWGAIHVKYDDQYVIFDTAWTHAEVMVDRLSEIFENIHLDYFIDYENGDESDCFQYN